MRFKLDIEKFSDNVFFKKNTKFFTMLLNLFNDKPKWKTLLHTSEFAELYSWILQCTPMLADSFYSDETRLYWIFNGLTNFPKCRNPKCGIAFDDRNVQTVIKGYPGYCTHKCAVNSDEIKEKSRKTCLEKYGVSSPGQSEAVKEKSRKTCLEKYGVEFTFQSSNFIEKSKSAIIEKFGVDHISKSDSIQDKIRKTKQEKYGENQPWHSKETYAKRKLTWMEKFGVDHPMKNTEVKKTASDTNLSRYGKKYWSQTESFRKDRLKMSYENIIMVNEFDAPCFSLDEYQNRLSDEEEFEFMCRKCGNIFKSRHHDGFHDRCPKCFPTSSSRCEKELADFITGLGFNVELNRRDIIKPKEIDIYIPDKNLAIEFDGLYWHSSKMLAEKYGIDNVRTYHLEKTEECAKLGIRLIHIFENEWIFNRKLVESRLKNMLGIYEHVTYARKCGIAEIDSKTSVEFQKKSHMQGSVNASVRLGLYSDGELVSLMTFGKCRFDKKHEWEMLRFCCKPGWHIPGAAGKLLKYFELKYMPKSLVSYADMRWSNGNLYRTLGFNFLRNSPPNYWYFSPSSIILESRINFQKHKLKNRLKNFNPNKSESENMEMNGFLKIFDCGNMVFKKIYPGNVN